MRTAEETFRSVATTAASDCPGHAGAVTSSQAGSDCSSAPRLNNKGGCSVFRCSMNLLVVGAGLRMVWVAGVLGRCGWLFGSALLAICCCIGFSMCLYLHKIYMDLQTRKTDGSGPGSAVLAPTYVSVIQVSLGRQAAIFTWLCMNVTMVGFQASSLVLTLQRLHEVFPNTLDHAQCCLVVSIVSAPFALIRSSVTLSYISMFGLLGSVVLAVSIFGAGLSQMLKNASDEDGAISSETSLARFNIEDSLIALGHAMMSFNMVLVALPQIGGMREPRKFPKALANTFGGLTMLYTILAVLTYGGYGAKLVLYGTPVDLIIQEGASGFRAVIIAAIILIAFAQYCGGFYTQGVSIDSSASFRGARWKQILARLAMHVLHTAIAYPCRTNMRLIVDILSASTVPLLAVILPAVLLLKHRHLAPTALLPRTLIYLAVLLAFVLLFCGSFNAVRRALTSLP